MTLIQRIFDWFYGKPLVPIVDSSKPPCNTCLYLNGDDCDACTLPVDGKCDRYKPDYGS